MRKNVADFTTELKLRVRKIIDAKAAMDNVTTVLKKLDVNLSNDQSVIALTLLAR